MFLNFLRATIFTVSVENDTTLMLLMGINVAATSGVKCRVMANLVHLPARKSFKSSSEIHNEWLQKRIVPKQKKVS